MKRALIAAGLALEGLALVALGQGEGGAFVAAAVLLHTASSYTLARGYWMLLPRRYRLPVRGAMGLLFALLWMLPVLGALGLLWSVLDALRRPLDRDARSAKIIIRPELPFSPPAVLPIPPYSQGALRQIVHFAGRPLKRLKAVMATRHMLPREAMPIWSKAMRDPVDDVRLLAYAMRDGNEKRLTQQILDLADTLPGVPLRRQRGCHETIAALCWELVYQRLAQGALRTHWLRTARRHLERVLEQPAPVSAPSSAVAAGSPGGGRSLGDDWLLYARILLDSDDRAAARAALAHARSAGIDEQKILPWLAEIAFRERDFAQTRRHLAALARPGARGGALARVQRWWTHA